jgi:hypothetical protein
MGVSNEVNFEELSQQELPDLDPEMTNHMKKCVQNLVLEVEHLKAFLKDKDESYISSNPEEVTHELIGSALSAAHIMGGYNTLEGIRESGMVPRITFTEETGGH